MSGLNCKWCLKAFKTESSVKKHEAQCQKKRDFERRYIEGRRAPETDTVRGVMEGSSNAPGSVSGDASFFDHGDDTEDPPVAEVQVGQNGKAFSRVTPAPVSRKKSAAKGRGVYLPPSVRKGRNDEVPGKFYEDGEYDPRASGLQFDTPDDESYLTEDDDDRSNEVGNEFGSLPALEGGVEDLLRKATVQVDNEETGQLDAAGVIQKYPNRSIVQLVNEWCWKSLDEKADKKDTTGDCVFLPTNYDSAQTASGWFTKSDLSMVRLIDFCDNNPVSSRDFVDRFLDTLVEEMDTNGFDPRKRLKRMTISKKVMARYGNGCEPRVAHLTQSTEDESLVMREVHVLQAEQEKPKRMKAAPKNTTNNDTNKDSNEEAPYRAVPTEVDDRERQILRCIGFEFKNQLLDLLDDSDIFGKLTNLVVNNDSNPFSPYKNTSNKIEEVLDGTWYRDTVERMKEDDGIGWVDGLDFLIPIIMYVDKTGTSMNQRYPLEPLLFTTAIIRRKVRNMTRSWRPLAYIPDLETKSAAEKRYVNTKNKGVTAKSYHLCLEHALKGLGVAQKEGIVTWLRLGDFMKKVRLRPEVAFVINDGKSADMLTLRLSSTHASRRISRSCLVLQEDCDDVMRDCQYVNTKDGSDLVKHFRAVGMRPMEVIEEMALEEREAIGDNIQMIKRGESLIEEAKAALNQLSFLPARNAFIACCISFGLDPRNIWGANPIDLMHAFQSGLVQYLVKMVVDKLSTRDQVRLDRLVDKLFQNLRSKEKEEYPRLTFSKGFSKLSMITSDEWPGKLFVLLLVLKTDEGRDILRKTFRGDDLDIPQMYANERNKSGKNKKKKQPNNTTFRDIWQQTQSFMSLYENDREIHKEKKKRGVPPPLEEAEETKTKKKTEDETEEMIRPCSMDDFAHLAEALLSFHAWYKLGIVPMDSKEKKADKDMIHNSVQRLLAMLRYYTPRKKGNNWKIQKFHDILHLALDIERFGPPPNFDAGPHESGLRIWAKLPAQTAQTRGYNTFVKQVASRVFEHQCMSTLMRKHGIVSVRDKSIKKAASFLSGEKQEDDGKTKIGGTAYRVYNTSPYGGFDAERGVALFRQSERMSKGNSKTAFTVHPVIESCLRWMGGMEEEGATGPPLQQEGDERFWELNTECSLVLPDDENRRVTLRCHPNYKGEGPWYDWIVVKFDHGGSIFQDHPDLEPEYPHECVPCKLLALASSGEGVMALIHGCEFRHEIQDRADDTVLVEKWQLGYRDLYDHLPANLRNKQTKGRARREDYMAPYLMWVDTKAIVSRCLVVEEEPGIHEVVPLHPDGKQKKNVMLIRKHNSWAEQFTG